MRSTRHGRRSGRRRTGPPCGIGRAHSCTGLPSAGQLLPARYPTPAIWSWAVLALGWKRENWGCDTQICLSVAVLS